MLQTLSPILGEASFGVIKQHNKIAAEISAAINLTEFFEIREVKTPFGDLVAPRVRGVRLA